MSDLRARLTASPEEDCGYQDVECWERQLRAAGWRPWNLRTGKESRGSTTWKAPNGLFYRGPYGAWCEMKKQTAMTDLRARLTALVQTWREKAASQGAIYAQGIEECADELAALLRESELASREAAEYPNQAGQSATEPARRKPALDAAQLTHILATWKEHSHPPPHLRRGPCPACGILIDLANVLRELSLERVTCRHCGEELRLIDGDWLDCETHTVCDTPAGQPVRQHEPEQQL